MTKEDIEKLLKRIVRTNEMLTIAQTNISDVNAIAVEIIMGMNTRRDDDEQSGPTIQ